MSFAFICAVALLASALTFFSGFGLGTLLLPAFALRFPIEVAIAATAVVHLANNLFKLVLVGRATDRSVMLRFAIPAAGAAWVGAWILSLLGDMRPIATWNLGERVCEVTWIKSVIAVIMAGFAAVELTPSFDRWAFDPRYLPLGGVISGFFGGVSGHQGALRSAFLVRCGLSKEAFIATGVASACIVDVARLAVYGREFYTEKFAAVGEGGGWHLVGAACLAAFIGAFAGARLVKKVTMRFVRVGVGIMLLGVSAALGAGVI
ncbi:hypothetical protein PHYC_03430 [Phycisphaerales bacterium]|nr:hypothetical protein PHYC_03430 [Phycisphaerales bacterium]